MNERKERIPNINIQDARLIFRNFGGKPSDYNREGERNFGVLLDPEIAQKLTEDGWNVKHLRPRNEEEEENPQAWLSVKIRFTPYPPIACLITPKGKVKLDEETIDQLDWSRIRHCDLVIRPYSYPPTGGRPGGIAAYLKSIYVEVDMDPVDEAYASMDYLN